MFHADGGVQETRYDVFGDARVLVDEIGRTEQRSYDRMGRLSQIIRPARTDGSGVQLTEHFIYDGFGRRVQHWTSQLGNSVLERADYDVEGRIVSTIDMGGHATSYSYVWFSDLTTWGFGTFGGWRKQSDNAAGLSAVAWIDYFGTEVGHTDYGGHIVSTGFDKGGRMTLRTTSIGGATGETTTFGYYNSGRLASQTSAVAMADIQSDGSAVGYARTTSAVYRYDADGNRTYEATSVTTTDPDLLADHGLSGSGTIQAQTVSIGYDGLGRMVSYADSGENAAHGVTIATAYDAVGNVRHVVANYSDLVTGAATQDYWYRYDSLNRFVTTKGVLSGTSGASGTTIVRGATGTDIVYDAASQRKSATKTIQGYLDLGGFGGISYEADQREDYSYTADGYLASVRIGAGSYDAPAAPTTGTLRAAYTRDAMGRVTDYAEYQADGTTIAYSRASTWDAGSLLTDDVVQQRQANGTMLTSTTHYDYTLSSSGAMWQPTGAGGAWQRVAFGTGGGFVGQVTHSKTTRSDGGVSETEYAYGWWDAAKKVHSGAVNPTATSLR